MKLSSIRVAIATWIAPAGTVVVPPLRSTPPPRVDIARTPRPPSPMITVHMPHALELAYSEWLHIEKCSDPSMWYAEHVGKQFPYMGRLGGDWRTRDSDGYINVILVGDAKIIHEEARP
jgi:hypothetical protein